MLMVKMYEGLIEHNEESIRTLFKVTYYSYEMKKVIMCFVTGSVLAIIGLIGSIPDILQVILLLIGCWLLVSGDLPSKVKADRTLKVRENSLPVIESIFYESYMELSNQLKMTIEYDKIQQLIEENQYLFIFLNRESVCMIDINKLKPYEPEMFKNFLTDKTGLEWKRNKAIFNMSLAEIVKTLAMK